VLQTFVIVRQSAEIAPFQSKSHSKVGADIINNQMGSAILANNFMKRFAVHFPVVALLVACLAGPFTSRMLAQEQPQKAPAAVQDSEPQPSDSASVAKIRVGTNEVNVVFTVTDKHGKRVPI
jgi:hypothetical protein